MKHTEDSNNPDRYMSLEEAKSRIIENVRKIYKDNGLI